MARKSNFDLIIRTKTPLDEEVEMGIFEIFNNARQISGFNATLEFRLDKEFPNRPLDTKLSAESHSTGSIEV